MHVIMTYYVIYTISIPYLPPSLPPFLSPSLLTFLSMNHNIDDETRALMALSKRMEQEEEESRKRQQEWESRVHALKEKEEEMAAKQRSLEQEIQKVKFKYDDDYISPPPPPTLSLAISSIFLIHVCIYIYIFDICHIIIFITPSLPSPHSLPSLPIYSFVTAALTNISATSKTKKISSKTLFVKPSPSQKQKTSTEQTKSVN